VRRALRISLVLALALGDLCLAFCGWLVHAPRHVPDGQPPLAVLDADSLPAFRDTFDRGAGETRILALLSPT
jgi:hypothetical protein